MTTQRRFFLIERRFSGNNMSRKGHFMSFSQRVLAGTFAAAMAVAPSFAEDAKVAPSGNGVTITEQDDKPTMLRQAVNYSKENPVVVIAILKGQKETLLTGEQVGDKLSAILKKTHGVPTKYFVAP